MSPSKASQWVCVTNITGDKVESDPVLIQLKHPKTGKPARFSLHEGKLCEIQKVDPEEKRSWFINDTVQQDGSLFFFTPVDPLFLLIPILETSRQETHESGGVFQQLDDILSSEEEFSYRHITELAGIDQQLNHICDSKAITDTIQVYRLNNEKVLTWLKCKVEMILEHFDSVPGLNQLILFLDSSELSSEQRQNLRRRAIVQTLGDYLSPSWRDKLLNAYDFEEIVNIENVINNSVIDSPADYIKKSIPKETADNESKKPKLTIAQKRLAKVNTKGMKKMDSYFKKRP